jgi:hypothetical protein
VKSISTQQILDFMEEGRGYSRSSFYTQFPDVETRLVNDALVLLTTRGEVWNGNGITYVKFRARTESKGSEPIICPSHAWQNLSGYEAGMRRVQRVAEASRGAGYTTRQFGGNAMTGRAGSEGFQGRAMNFMVMR